MPDDVTAAPKGIVGGVKRTLTKKLGPLPVWGWAGIGIVVGGAVWYMGKHRGASTPALQGGAVSVDSGGPIGSGGGGGGTPGEITAPPTSPPVSTPGGEGITPITPVSSSIDNRPPAVQMPGAATITAPTPEEIAYAINRRNASTGDEQSQWKGVTQEHTQRLAASLNQTPQGRQQLSNVTTAYKASPTAAEAFFTECAKNPAGCNAMFGGG